MKRHPNVCFTCLVKSLLWSSLFLLLPMLCVADNPVVITLEKMADGHKEIVATNSGVIPYTVKLEFGEFGNIKVNKQLPLFFVVPAKSKTGPVLTIESIADKKGFFNYQSTTYPGDCLNSKHDDNVAYFMPFKHGTKHLLEQGYNGGITHIGDSGYAVDFRMPIGTAVYAARDGIVSTVKEDSDVGGMDKKYAHSGNYISVYHRDGSTANYVHLKKNGAIVKKGDLIKAGTHIGYSGNTGLSKGPHLHFEVRMPYKKDFRPITIPVRFLGPDGKARTLDSNKWYYASHEGKPVFDIQLGRHLKNRDFKQYKKRYEHTNNVSIRQEKLDSTTIYYVGNGLNNAIELKIEFDLINMSMSTSNPVKLIVPAHEERFLCLLRPKVPKGHEALLYKMQSNYKYDYRILN